MASPAGSKKPIKTLSQTQGFACAYCSAEPPAETIDGPAGARLLKPPTGLSSCARCKRVKYCNAWCQKQDYAQHKVPCSAYAVENEHELALGDRARFTKDESVECMQRLGGVLASAGVVTPSPWVSMFLTVKRCRNCLRTVHMVAGDAAHRGAKNPVAAAFAEFTHCARCRIATCCSDACWSEYYAGHVASGSCDSLRMVDEYSCFAWLSLVQNNEDDVAYWMPVDRKTEAFAGFPDASVAKGPRAVIPVDGFELPHNINYGLGWPAYLAHRKAWDAPPLPGGLWLASTGVLSRPITAFHALHQAYGDDWLRAVTTLTVHCIGTVSAAPLPRLAYG